MSALVRRSLGLVGSCVIVSSVVLAVLGGLESTGRADPKPGAATAPALVSRLGKAVDTGDGAVVLACFDISKPGSRVFPDYLVAETALNAGRIAVRHKADTYGAAVRAKAEPLLEPWWAQSSTPYARSLCPDPCTAKEGSEIRPPGSKIEMVIVKKHGVFLFDASQIFQDPGGADSVAREQARFEELAREWIHVAASATSAEDLLAKLTKLANE